MNLLNLLKSEITQQDLLNYYNANINYVKLSKGINGFVDSFRGINTIYINDNLSYYKKKKTIIHELAHIELNQLNQIDKDLFAFKIDKFEDDADKYIELLKKSI